MISHVHLLSPPERGSVQANASSQSGRPDFGALLQAQESDGKTPQGREQESSQDPSLHSSPRDPARAPAMTETESAALPASAQMAESVESNVFGGTNELVANSWRLQANAGLSYVVTATPGVEESTHTPQHDALPQPSAADPASAQATVALHAESASNVEGLHWLQPQTASRERDTVASAPAATIEATDPATDAGATSPVWTERLLRWVSDSDGNGSTAWIRDYRMDPAQATRLIDSLRGIADQQGRQLNRVVLNGHEVWRSDSTHPDNPRKG